MKNNRVGKIFNRTAVVALAMAFSTLGVKSAYDVDAFLETEKKPVIIDTIPIEDLPGYDDNLSDDTSEDYSNVGMSDNEEKDDNNIRYLEEFLAKSMELPASMLNDYSIQALITELYSYLGKDIHCKELTSENGNIKAEIFNNDGKYVILTKYPNNTFFANYGEDLWFVDAFTYGSEQFNKQYYAGENDFYRSEFNNNFLVNESIFYKNQDDKMMTISIYDEGQDKTLYIIPEEGEALDVALSEEDYMRLSIIMACYANGDDLNNFLLESDFAKYLDIVAIRDLELYYKLIGYDKTKSLKLTTL